MISSLLGYVNQGTVGYITVKTFIKILQCRIKKLDAIQLLPCSSPGTASYFLSNY